MTSPAILAELWRGGMLEGVHYGHAVICDEKGEIIESWGDPNAVIFPRSSCKMVQALPLVESGVDLTTEQLALACASHDGAHIHSSRVATWLSELGLSESDMRCGVQMPQDREAKLELLKTDQSACQLHNNCSGKHAGFLTLNQRIGGNAEYHEVDHPIQQGCKSAMEDLADQATFGYGIDGCSAPNFATTVHGLGRAMSFFASAHTRSDTRSVAAHRLSEAMRAFPELVAGEGRACTELMRAMDGKVAIKTGAEAVYVAILPEQKIGISLKVLDGSTRASECAIAAILVKLGVLAYNHPATRKRMDAVQKNWNGMEVGEFRAADVLR